MKSGNRMFSDEDISSMKFDGEFRLVEDEKVYSATSNVDGKTHSICAVVRDGVIIVFN